MADVRFRTGVIRLAAGCAVAAAVIAGIPVAQADSVAYLVNVTMRPGYNFAGPDAAIAYGNGVCARIGQGVSYADLLTVIKADFRTDDDYQASYLITQAANELCPAQIGPLRDSAAGFRPAP